MCISLTQHELERMYKSNFGNEAYIFCVHYMYISNDAFDMSLLPATRNNEGNFVKPYLSWKRDFAPRIRPA